MNDIPTAGDLIEVQSPGQLIPFKYAVVVGLFQNNTAKITFDGEDSASEKQYAYLDSYIPTIGDRVLLAASSGTYIILGKVKYNEAPSTPGGSTPGGGSDFDTITTSGLATLNSLEVTNNALVKKDITVNGNTFLNGQFKHNGTLIGFFNAQATTKKACSNLQTGAALGTVVTKINELLGYLRNYGLIS